MILARVVGTVVATRKHRSHEGCKILMVQPLDLDDRETGDTLLALDGGNGVGAGVGDRVLVVQEGWSAATTIGPEGTPIDAAIVGVVDTVELADADSPDPSAT
jgi:ethanolamine utilization protein EutN